MQDYIDDQRPVTAKDCLVLAPTEVQVEVNVDVSLSDLSIDDARAQITSAINDYFNRLAPGEVAVRNQLGGLITDVVGVIDYNMKSPTANVVPVVDQNTVQWCRPGAVNIGLMP
ncbi:baseplate J/gp47 family protein [Enterobacter kobei]|uniref:baseplate J/gp47 family protein n=1 Tax=Enterobacter kobei TaxID=208224 RepID=UPI003CE70604